MILILAIKARAKVIIIKENEYMKLLFYTSIFYLLISCSLNEPYLEGHYTGFYIETAFHYDFYPDHTFRSEYHGHAGNDTITGDYMLKPTKAAFLVSAKLSQ